MKKIKIIMLLTCILALVMLIVSCGSSKSSNKNTINNYYDDFKQTTPVKNSETVKNNSTTTQKVDTKCSHKYQSKVTKEATCSQQGTKTFTCSLCNDSYTEVIATLNHIEVVDKAVTATCTKDGLSEGKHCYNCNKVIIAQAIVKAKGHTVDANNVCTICNQQALPMTNQEIEIAKKITDIRINSTSTDFTNGTNLWIRLCDENNEQYIAPFIIEIKIINDNGKTIYNETKNITSADFQQNADPSIPVPGPLAEIPILKENIVKDSVDSGTIYFKIYNPGYFMTGENGERKGSITGLMERLEVPTLPVTISSTNTITKITNVTYEVSGDNLYIYLTGEKLYDSKSSSYSRACKIGWKLYDSEGYLVDSGILYTDALRTGEKFKNAKVYCLDVIDPSLTYRLELVDVDG